MEQVGDAGNGTLKRKMPDGKFCYIDPRDKGKFPQRLWCVKGKMTPTKCPAKWLALGPAPNQVHLKVPHKPNCQRSLPPPDNDEMKKALIMEVVANPACKLIVIYEEVKKR